ncbi:MAG: histidine triad nucleotide-binding protein [Gemmatimonadales bacterium]
MARGTGDCLFCKIAAGEIPAQVVAEDDHYVAFADINPQAPTHVLAIPREHVRSLNEAEDVGALGGLLLFARRVAKNEGLLERGYRVILNTNADGGQTVFHLHAHVLGGRAMQWPPG